MQMMLLVEHFNNLSKRKLYDINNLIYVLTDETRIGGMIYAIN